MSDIVDLDALVPKPATVRFEGAEVTVQPPKVHTVLRIADFWQTTRLGTAIPEKDLIKAISDMKQEIVSCIPELADRELSYAQLVVLVELLTKMTLPPEAQEMKEKGISGTEGPKAE